MDTRAALSSTRLSTPTSSIPSDMPSIPSRSRISRTLAAAVRGRARAGARHRLVLPCAVEPASRSLLPLSSPSPAPLRALTELADELHGRGELPRLVGLPCAAMSHARARSCWSSTRLVPPAPSSRRAAASSACLSSRSPGTRVATASARRRRCFCHANYHN